VNNIPPQDLRVFIHGARRASFRTAADELGAYVSKRISMLKETLEVKSCLPYDPPRVPDSRVGNTCVVPCRFARLRLHQNQFGVGTRLFDDDTG
jgi:hypothetical protein